MNIRFKNIILYGFSIMFLFGSVSCSDYLDKEPATDVDPTAAYKTFFNFQGFVEEMYNCIPNFEKRDNNCTWNFGEEEVVSTNGLTWHVNQFDLGNFWIFYTHWNGHWLYGTNFDASSTDRGRHYLWQGCWYGIRKANLGLANLDKMTGTQEEKDLIAGQLYFFRAWFHFQLTKWWGGMPYIDRVIPASEKFNEPRLTYLESTVKIAEDFQKAVDLLPMNWDNTVVGKNTIGNNELRINKTMAKAYLGKTYLYAGSPWNKVGGDGYGTYDAEYCKKAANVLGTILQESEDNLSQYKLVEFSRYTELWMTNGQGQRMPGLTEAIFRGPDYENDGNFGSESVSREYAAADILQGRSWAQYPTANYANYFGMANGLPINENSNYKNYFDAGKSDVTSGYDKEYPWRNRDPRFYITFGYDTRRMIVTPPSNAVQWTFANLYSYGGASDDLGTYRRPWNGSPTGYLLYKFTPLGFNRYDNYSNGIKIHVPWLRLADVYLMYAEAVDNGFGSPNSSSDTYSLTALEAVNKIRDRAGAGHFATKYSTGSGIDSPFMTELIRERAVELAWEGHRYHDLRRWRLLDKYPYNIKTKIEFNRAEPVNFNKVDPTQNRVLNLREEVHLTRNFGEKHYWLPIIKSDATIYSDFPQNPGW